MRIPVEIDLENHKVYGHLINFSKEPGEVGIRHLTYTTGIVVDKDGSFREFKLRLFREITQEELERKQNEL